MDALDPVHISRLRLMSKSAAHYAAGFDGNETYAMERGTAVHSLVLGDGSTRIMKWAEGKPRRGKEFEAFKADNPDALILTHSEGEKVLAMAAAVRGDKLAMSVLEGERETERAWKSGNRECAGTPDVVGRLAGRPGHVTELKTCMTSMPARFTWHAMRMGYPAQLAWYIDGLMLGGRVAVDDGYIVAVESSAPFPVTVFQVTPRALDVGRRLYRLWWEQLMVCEASNTFPPYAQSIVDLDVPDDDQQLDFGDEAA